MIKTIFSFFTGGWLAPLAGVAVLLAGLYGWHAYQVRGAFDDGAAAVQARWDQDTDRRNALHDAAREDKRVKEATHAEELATERAARAAESAVLAAARADNRALLQRLRTTLAAHPSGAVQASADPGAGPDPDAAPATTGDVLGECAGEVVELGEQTEDLAIRLRGLQTWASSAVRLCGG